MANPWDKYTAPQLQPQQGPWSKYTPLPPEGINHGGFKPNAVQEFGDTISQDVVNAVTHPLSTIMGGLKMAGHAISPPMDIRRSQPLQAVDAIGEDVQGQHPGRGVARAAEITLPALASMSPYVPWSDVGTAVKGGAAGGFNALQDLKTYGPSLAGSEIGRLINPTHGPTIGAVAGGMPNIIRGVYSGAKNALNPTQVNPIVPAPSLRPTITLDQPGPVAPPPLAPVATQPQPQPVAPPSLRPPITLDQPQPVSAPPLAPIAAQPQPQPVAAPGLAPLKTPAEPESGIAPPKIQPMPEIPMTWSRANNGLHSTLQEMSLPNSPSGVRATPGTVGGMMKAAQPFGKADIHDLSPGQVMEINDFIVKNKRLPNKGELK